MLIGLSIRDVVLIDRLELEFQPGFTVLTGETGAGKSILLDSLGLALGMRGDNSLIRQGADQAVVAAEFDVQSLQPDHPLWNLLQEHGLFLDTSSLMLRRLLSRDGKSKAFLNDQTISIRLLKQIGEVLLEIHSQFDHLFDVSLHQEILDRFSLCYHPALTTLLEEVKESYQAWRQAEIDLKQYQKSCQESFDQKTLHQHVVEDLSSLHLVTDEEQILLQQRQLLAQYGKISHAVQQALKELNQPLDLVGHLVTIQKNLERANTVDSKDLNDITETLERSVLEIQEAQETLKKLYYQDQESVQKLEQVDERLHLLRALARRYHVTADELASFLEKSQNFLNQHENAEESLEKLQKNLEQAWADYQEKCQKLSFYRQQGALELQKAVEKELFGLKLDQASFVVSLQPKHPTNLGMDEVEFLIAANPGQKPSGLQKVASGGELSRLMLALKVVLTQHGFLSTLIFDEVDTGVGGAVAAAIGQRLVKLAQYTQVLAITHLPQVAAYASHHFCVVKKTRGDQNQTEVYPLTGSARTDELARMLAGTTITSEARAAANQLLLTGA